MITTSRHLLRSSSGGEIYLARARDVGPKERGAAVSGAQLRMAMFHAVDHEPSRRKLAAFLDHLGLGRYAVLASSSQQTLEALERGFESHHLVAFELPRRRIVMPVVPDTPVLGPEAEPTSWIEVLLVDEDGEPIRDEPYKIEDPSGRVWQGTTNVNGMARIEGIDPGSCKVSFPALPPEWKKAG